MVGSGVRCASLRRVLKLSGHFIPDFFAVKIAALGEFPGTGFDSLVCVKSVMGAAKFCVHYNRVSVRNPHD
jgi:hypothetical protein